MLKPHGKIVLAVFTALSLCTSVAVAKGHGHHKEKHNKEHGWKEHGEHEWEEHEEHERREHEPVYRGTPVYGETPPIAPPIYGRTPPIYGGTPPIAPPNFNDQLRYIVIENRYTGYESLPPGIRKKLARGKRIPPGLAYRVVPVQVLNTLPVYPGAEWRVYGTDLVLINLANQLIQQTILGIFR